MQAGRWRRRRSGDGCIHSLVFVRIVEGCADIRGQRHFPETSHRGANGLAEDQFTDRPAQIGGDFDLNRVGQPQPSARSQTPATDERLPTAVFEALEEQQLCPPTGVDLLRLEACRDHPGLIEDEQILGLQKLG